MTMITAEKLYLIKKIAVFKLLDNDGNCNKRKFRYASNVFDVYLFSICMHEHLKIYRIPFLIQILEFNRTPWLRPFNVGSRCHPKKYYQGQVVDTDPHQTPAKCCGSVGILPKSGSDLREKKPGSGSDLQEKPEYGSYSLYSFIVNSGFTFFFRSC